MSASQGLVTESVMDLGQLVLHLGQYKVVGSKLGSRRLERGQRFAVPSHGGLSFTAGNQGGYLGVAEGESPLEMADRLGMGVRARCAFGGKPPPPVALASRPKRSRWSATLAARTVPGDRSYRWDNASAARP